MRTSPANGYDFRLQMAISRASRARVGPKGHGHAPANDRAAEGVDDERHVGKPEHVLRWVTSATRGRFGAGAVNARPTRSAGHSAPSQGCVVWTFLPRTAAAKPSAPNESCHPIPTLEAHTPDLLCLTTIRSDEYHAARARVCRLYYVCRIFPFLICNLEHIALVRKRFHFCADLDR